MQRSTVQTEQGDARKGAGAGRVASGNRMCFLSISVGQCVCFTGVLFLYHFSGIALFVNVYDLK